MAKQFMEQYNQGNKQYNLGNQGMIPRGIGNLTGLSQSPSTDWIYTTTTTTEPIINSGYTVANAPAGAITYSGNSLK